MMYLIYKDGPFSVMSIELPSSWETIKAVDLMEARSENHTLQGEHLNNIM